MPLPTAAKRLPKSRTISDAASRRIAPHQSAAVNHVGWKFGNPLRLGANTM